MDFFSRGPVTMYRPLKSSPNARTRVFRTSHEATCEDHQLPCCRTLIGTHVAKYIPGAPTHEAGVDHGVPRPARVTNSPMSSYHGLFSQNGARYGEVLGKRSPVRRIRCAGALLGTHSHDKIVSHRRIEVFSDPKVLSHPPSPSPPVFVQEFKSIFDCHSSL